MITPQEESYRANEPGTSPILLGGHPTEPVASEDETASSVIARTHELLFEPRQVVELRAFKGRETVSGYFDSGEPFVYEAAKLDERGYTVYVTLNEVNPVLLARAANRTRK